MVGNLISGGRERVTGCVQLMTSTLRPVLLTALILTGTTAACGSDAEETLTTAEFRTQANEICTVGGDEVHAAYFGVFGSDEVTPDQMEEALATVMAVTRRQLDDIEALTEPSAMTADVAEFLAAGRADTDTAEAMGLGFFEYEDDVWASTGELAVGLGLDACAGG